jgi:hypothetical protein
MNLTMTLSGGFAIKLILISAASILSSRHDECFVILIGWRTFSSDSPGYSNEIGALFRTLTKLS